MSIESAFVAASTLSQRIWVVDDDRSVRFVLATALRDAGYAVAVSYTHLDVYKRQSPRFAEGWLSRMEGGGWLLEAHPVGEFPALDPTQALPSALAAALKGLAHELRNPLAGLKGAAQLLARRASHRDQEERELIELIGSEIERLNGLLDQLLSPSPQRPHAPLNIHLVLELSLIHI